MATTGIDITTANKVLDALTPAATSGTTTVGSLIITAPIKCRFCSAMTTTDSGASTEWTTGTSGYPTGGVSTSTGWASASAGQKSTSSAITVTNAPATTWAGNELWDSSATPVRTFWGAITGGSKTVNAGDTCTISAGSLTVSLT
jgi:hypothetical protein